jgi:hypothetical protein
MLSIFFGERSLTKVAALFDQAVDARTAAERVVRVGRLPLRRVLIVAPADPAVERKLKAEVGGALSTPVKARVSLGTAGFVLGLLSGWALVLAGVESASASPYYTVALTATFGLIVGLILGSMADRPDHAELISQVMEGLGKGQWAVVVNPTNWEQVNRALDVLEYCGGDLIQAS